MLKCEICGQDATHEAGGHQVCAVCWERISDYENRVLDRVERLRKAASKSYTEGSQAQARARQLSDIIPMGQPILVGHHSESRHRNLLKKIDNGYRRGYEAIKRGHELGRKADAAESNRAISSDDPAALIKLKDKLASLEAVRAEWKRFNAEMRKVAKYPHQEQVEKLRVLFPAYDVERLLKPDFAGRVGIPDYRLVNSASEVRRLKERIKEMEHRAAAVRAAQDAPPDDISIGAVTIIRAVEDNRLRVKFPGKPPADIISMLKSRGFRWSPSNGAWQRHLSPGAEYDAKFIAEKFGAQS